MTVPHRRYVDAMWAERESVAVATVIQGGRHSYAGRSPQIGKTFATACRSTHFAVTFNPFRSDV